MTHPDEPSLLSEGRLIEESLHVDISRGFAVRSLLAIVLLINLIGLGVEPLWTYVLLVARGQEKQRAKFKF